MRADDEIKCAQKDLIENRRWRRKQTTCWTFARAKQQIRGGRIRKGENNLSSSDRAGIKWSINGTRKAQQEEAESSTRLPACSRIPVSLSARKLGSRWLNSSPFYHLEMRAHKLSYLWRKCDRIWNYNEKLFSPLCLSKEAWVDGASFSRCEAEKSLFTKHDFFVAQWFFCPEKRLLDVDGGTQFRKI